MFCFLNPNSSLDLSDLVDAGWREARRLLLLLLPAAKLAIALRTASQFVTLRL